MMKNISFYVQNFRKKLQRVAFLRDTAESYIHGAHT